jgi:hypothetical protein
VSPKRQNSYNLRSRDELGLGRLLLQWSYEVNASHTLSPDELRDIMAHQTAPGSAWPGRWTCGKEDFRTRLGNAHSVSKGPAQCTGGST